MSKLIDWWTNVDKSNGIKNKDVPEQYRDNFQRAMFGQTCGIDEETGELLHYSWDVERWVYWNQDI